MVARVREGGKKKGATNDRGRGNAAREGRGESGRCVNDAKERVNAE